MHAYLKWYLMWLPLSKSVRVGETNNNNNSNNQNNRNKRERKKHQPNKQMQRNDNPVHIYQAQEYTLKLV